MDDELNDGKIISRNIMGVDLIAWQSRDGISITEPHCPHLGVHLGSGGSIQNGRIVCPLHRRAYNGDGSCTNKTRASLKSFPATIRLGVVFAWLDTGEKEPTWDLPDLEVDMHGMRWGTAHDMLRGIVVPAHPIEFIENGVDYHHAVKLHGMCHEGSSMTANEQKLSVEFRRKNTEKGAINIHAYGPFIIDYNVDYVVRGKTRYSRFFMLLQFNTDGSFRAHRIKLYRLDHKESLADKIIRHIMFIFNEIKLFKAFMKEDQMIMINRKYITAPDYDEHDLYSNDFRKWYSQFVPASNLDCHPPDHGLEQISTREA